MHLLPSGQPATHEPYVKSSDKQEDIMKSFGGSVSSTSCRPLTVTHLRRTYTDHDIDYLSLIDDLHVSLLD